MLSLGSKPSFLVVSFNNSGVNRVLLSVMISWGSLCSLTLSFMKRFANYCSSRSIKHGTKWVILVSRLMTPSLVSYLSYFGRSVIKSIAIDFHARSGMLFDCSNP